MESDIQEFSSAIGISCGPCPGAAVWEQEEKWQGLIRNN